MSDEMPNFKGLTEAVLNTSSPLAEGAEALRQAADTAYWDIESLGSTLMRDIPPPSHPPVTVAENMSAGGKL